MLLVVDSNVLFSFFKRDSATAGIFNVMQLGLFSPEYALTEIRKHAEEIREKAGISPEKFNELKKKLALVVEFVPEQKYKGCLREAGKIVQDKDDVDFIALALKLGLPIWSNDKLLKQQYSTRLGQVVEVESVVLKNHRWTSGILSVKNHSNLASTQSMPPVYDRWFLTGQNRVIVLDSGEIIKLIGFR